MPTHPRIRRPSALVLAVVAASLVLIASASTAAFGSSGPHPLPPKPTIVLVHGAWADASSFSAVTERLQADGFTVIAPANPLRDVDGDAAYLASILNTITGPIVLVGHSYGGMVITNAALGIANVKALVYVDAFAPDTGESLASIGALNPGSQLTPAAFTFRPFDGGTDAYITPSLFRQAFAADVSPTMAAEMAAAQRPLSAAVLGEPSGPPAWRTIPSWYEVGTQDNAIPPATQRFMAKRMGAHTIEVPSSHMAMISHPDTVTHLILAAVAGSA